MTKLLFLVPHLSTGGLPQYTLKKIELLRDSFDIYCIEWENTGGDAFVVQRNQIKELLGNKFFCANGNTQTVISTITAINPDIVHLEEIPEFWAPVELCQFIYDKARTYKLFETSHDSSFDTSKKIWFPDKFLFVSQWQINQYQHLGIPCELVEYPIEYKERGPDGQQYAVDKLGMDPDRYHVIHVGLWTSRKNQAELIDYARMLQKYPIDFHFVGNQASNFYGYWEPLMRDLPSNCTVWGERNDVDLFYQAADLMVFTSRGTENDKETMPLVIREAISWRLPTLIYNLPVYLNYFDKFESISYLNEEHAEVNARLICEKLGIDFNGVKPVAQKHFIFNYNEDNQNITYTLLKPVGNYLISIKDIDSKACIWSTRTGSIRTGQGGWVQPRHKDYYNFKENPLFGGFQIDVFSGNHLVQQELIRFKEPSIYKPEFDLSDDQPIWENYNEFFMERKYDRFIKPGTLDTVLDIGASIGLFTAYLKERGAKKIYAFEPNKDALVQLRRNYGGDSSVVIDPRAIAGKYGHLWFHTNPDNTLISALHSNIEKAEKSYKVEATTIGDFFKSEMFKDAPLSIVEWGGVDLVKIDVEGAEYEIIESLTELEYAQISAFLIETHEFYFPDGEEKNSKLIKSLENNGYDVTRHSNFVYATKRQAS